MIGWTSTDLLIVKLSFHFCENEKIKKKEKIKEKKSKIISQCFMEKTSLQGCVNCKFCFALEIGKWNIVIRNRYYINEGSNGKKLWFWIKNVYCLILLISDPKKIWT